MLRSISRGMGRAAFPQPPAGKIMERRMASLMGSRTEDNLKAAFAGESQANRRYCILRRRRISRATTTYRRYSARPPRARLAMPTAISNISRRLATRRPGNRSAGLRITFAPRLLAKPTNIRTCIRGWPARLAKRVSRRSPSGLKPSPKPKGLTPAAFRRLSMGSEQV